MVTSVDLALALEANRLWDKGLQGEVPGGCPTDPDLAAAFAEIREKHGKIDIRHIRRADLKTVFPCRTGEPSKLDVQLVRLIVLFEDLRVEIDQLKEGPAGHKLGYFLRRSVATMHEFGDAIELLDSVPEFSSRKALFPSEHREVWSEAVQHFRKHSGKKGGKRTLTAIRDDIGGHFGEKAAVKALKALGSLEANIEIIEDPITRGVGCRLPFANDLALTVLAYHADGEDFEKWFSAFLATLLGSYRHAVRAVEVVFEQILSDRFQPVE